jgi:hypothetical protein
MVADTVLIMAKSFKKGCLSWNMNYRVELYKQFEESQEWVDRACMDEDVKGIYLANESCIKICEKMIEEFEKYGGLRV